jgi:hypothetical protein
MNLEIFKGIINNLVMDYQKKKITLHFSDSFNYTFNSMGSILGIILLNCILVSYAEKYAIIFLHVGSLIGIVIINRDYYNNYKSNHYLMTNDPNFTAEVIENSTFKPDIYFQASENIKVYPKEKYPGKGNSKPITEPITEPVTEPVPVNE